MAYEDQNRSELQSELRRRGLPTSGNKDELVARLELHDAEHEEDTVANEQRDDSPEAVEERLNRAPREEPDFEDMTEAQVSARRPFGVSEAELGNDPYGDTPHQQRPENQDPGVVGEEAGDTPRSTMVSGINPGAEAQESEDPASEPDTPQGTLPPV